MQSAKAGGQLGGSEFGMAADVVARVATPIRLPSGFPRPGTGQVCSVPN